MKTGYLRLFVLYENDDEAGDYWWWNTSAYSFLAMNIFNTSKINHECLIITYRVIKWKFRESEWKHFAASLILRQNLFECLWDCLSENRKRKLFWTLRNYKLLWRGSWKLMFSLMACYAKGPKGELCILWEI